MLLNALKKNGQLLPAKSGIVGEVQFLYLRHLLEHFIQLANALVVQIDLTDGQVLKVT